MSSFQCLLLLEIDVKLLIVNFYQKNDLHALNQVSIWWIICPYFENYSHLGEKIKKEHPLFFILLMEKVWTIFSSILYFYCVYMDI